MKLWKATLVLEILSFLVLATALFMRHKDGAGVVQTLSARLIALAVLIIFYLLIFGLQACWYAWLHKKTH
ncbi:DUF3923 family protein [Fructilactobacillus myrtifloralis]|uniref:DUF3923 family protein n=1 Tax=Fructilactobacillus myrtifloralis TaxID=2940301 RepID=A0ABY5BQJ9_9LACO|nr:DUF3923 family protein [Fructilactobacillus myrtifloralis]USS84866.1 DUF3923 family protein [Fructilactobacillus myrtifloralis]